VPAGYVFLEEIFVAGHKITKKRFMSFEPNFIIFSNHYLLRKFLLQN